MKLSILFLENFVLCLDLISFYLPPKDYSDSLVLNVY